MGWGKDNPCFGCVIKLPDQTIRKAPCCHNVTLDLTQKQYVQHFSWADKDNHSERYERRIDDNPSVITITIKKACLNLDQVRGTCLINDDKPEDCRLASPKHFQLCAQASNGRNSADLFKF